MDGRDRLDAALALPNETERKLAVVALIDELVQRIGFRAIVIGGLAVELWTHGAYSTGDIDLYLPHGPAVDDLLAELGFEKRGRHWVVEDAGLFVEAPASFPAPEEEVTEVQLSTGATVLVLSPEDALVYRLHEFVGTGHVDAAEQSVALLSSDDLDHARLVRRAESERLLPTLAEVERISQRLRRGEAVETWELHEIARRLRLP
ncbi:MAG TPA: hypothetical protein VLB86_03840 [Gaiellaceae bacterium]|nr:hypothetical protein [Gaiellaceae bacterium]